METKSNDAALLELNLAGPQKGSGESSMTLLHWPESACGPFAADFGLLCTVYGAFGHLTQLTRTVSEEVKRYSTFTARGLETAAE